MEYVLVTHPEDRTVYVDGEDNGLSNTIIRVDSGTHRFDLGELQNYEPPFIEIEVSNTSALEPLTLVFSPRGNA